MQKAKKKKKRMLLIGATARREGEAGQLSCRAVLSFFFSRERNVFVMFGKPEDKKEQGPSRWESISKRLQARRAKSAVAQ